MKKKILCLLLILALLPIGFMFAGCANKVYSLSNLEADYNALTDDCTAFKVNTVGESKEIIVDYSVYKDSSQASFLKNLVETKEPYKKLNTFYNETFNNSMTFAYAYLKDCSKQDYIVDSTLATEVETRLKDLKSAIKSIDDATQQLADVVKFSLVSGDAFDTSCMYELRNVFEKYET
ncbi:MAG: hypothetical protein MJ149_02395, partial [Clostridia bacterium]|nr:hypothetical protein [Clostridia bacterium]